MVSRVAGHAQVHIPSAYLGGMRTRPKDPQTVGDDHDPGPARSDVVTFTITSGVSSFDVEGPGPIRREFSRVPGYSLGSRLCTTWPHPARSAAIGDSESL